MFPASEVVQKSPKRPLVGRVENHKSISASKMLLPFRNGLRFLIAALQASKLRSRQCKLCRRLLTEERCNCLSSLGKDVKAQPALWSQPVLTRRHDPSPLKDSGLR